MKRRESIGRTLLVALTGSRKLGWHDQILMQLDELSNVDANDENFIERLMAVNFEGV
jgi:hypothetical protein